MFGNTRTDPEPGGPGLSVRNPTAFGLYGDQDKEGSVPEKQKELHEKWGEEKKEEKEDEEEETMRSLLRAWADNSSANGIPNTARSVAWIRKLCWLLLVLAGAGLTLLQVYEIFETFYEYPVSISVNLTYSSSLDFPAVTICNNNMVRKSTLPMAAGALSSILPYSYGLTTDTSNLVTGYGRAIVRGEFNTAWAELNDTVRQAMGHQAEDMIIDCLYNGELCDQSDFAEFINPIYGNCYTFNSNSSRTKISHRSGPDYGLTIELYIDQDEYISELTEAAGVRVVLHPQDAMPFPEDDGILVAPAQITLLGTTLENITRLQLPYPSACWDMTVEEAAYNSAYSELYGTEYSLAACHKTCYQMNVIGNCSCGDSTYPMEGFAVRKLLDDITVPIGPCQTLAEIDCELTVKHQYSNDELECNCSIPCQSFTYLTTMSRGHWPSDSFKPIYYDELAGRNAHLATLIQAYEENGTDPSSSLVKLQIFYEQFNYEIVDEVASYPRSQLLSDLGGAIGFYLGVSIIACFEFLELLIDCIRIGILKILKGSTRTPVNKISH